MATDAYHKRAHSRHPHRFCEERDPGLGSRANLIESHKLPNPSSAGLTLTQVEIAWLAMITPESDFSLAFERAGENNPSNRVNWTRETQT